MSGVRELLFLAHRIPYPPNKGDKIRSWHILRHLAGRWRVRLGAFVDDPADREHEAVLRDLCADCCLVDLEPRRARLRSLRGLVTGEPLTVPYYGDARLAKWVRSAAGGAQAVFAFSSSMIPYARLARGRSARTVIDFVDVDSEKWRSYGEARPGPLGWIWRREARTLLAFERASAAWADASVFVSAAEAALFRRLAPEAAARIHAVPNGVDCAFFAPDPDLADPFDGAGPALVFTGAMDYWPNVDAVAFFAQSVLPLVRARHPNARFWIVGGNPAPEVVALGRLEGIAVTGRVPDVRPYLAHAAAAVAPLRIARGVQNKVLEAMAMARPVVVTPEALEGIAAEPGRHVRVGTDPVSLADQIAQVLADPSAPAMGTAARRFVQEHHDWAASLGRLDALLEAGPCPAPAGAMDAKGPDS